MKREHPASRVIRFGVFELDLQSRELHKQGLKIKLQEQPFQVLEMLLERPGQVVSREELEQKLWSNNTFVDFDHSLNITINKIRQALGDTAESPRYVETLARRGYRFIGTVDGSGQGHNGGYSGIAPTADRPFPSGAIPWTQWRARSIYLLAALLAMIGGIVWLYFHNHNSSLTIPPMRVVPFTGFAGHEGTPAFSPDGNQIAFVWDGEKGDNNDIYVKQIGTGNALRLTTNPADDLVPAWSPDGRFIAFIRSTEAERGVFIVPALGGPERKLCSTSVDGFLAWSPDGKFLAVKNSEQEPHGIYLLSVENLEKRRVTSAIQYRGLPNRCDRHCSFSPDGQTLAFVRWNVMVSDLYLVPVGSGEPRRFTFDNSQIGGLDWAPNGQEIVFSSNRAGSSGLWRISSSGGTPERLSIGADNAFSPSISRRGHRLAYVRGVFDTNIWRIELSSSAARWNPSMKLISSTQEDLGPQYSPDGKRIVFSSERSGSFELWICNSDGSNLVQLTSFGGPGAGTPRWSPDGRQIAFGCFREGQADIYVVNTELGVPHRLTSETSDDVVPSWSRDGQWIYFSSDRSGTQQVWKMPAQGGKAVRVTKEGGLSAFESTDGKFVYYSKTDTAGIWKIPVDGGSERMVLGLLKKGYWGYWALVEQGIYFFNQESKAIEFFNFAKRRRTQVATLEKEPYIGNPGLAVSPDGRFILYTQVDQDNSNIMLVENFR